MAISLNTVCHADIPAVMMMMITPHSCLLNWPGLGLGLGHVRHRLLLIQRGLFGHNGPRLHRRSRGPRVGLQLGVLVQWSPLPRSGQNCPQLAGRGSPAPHVHRALVLCLQCSRCHLDRQHRVRVPGSGRRHCSGRQRLLPKGEPLSCCVLILTIQDNSSGSASSAVLCCVGACSADPGLCLVLVVLGHQHDGARASPLARGARRVCVLCYASCNGQGLVPLPLMVWSLNCVTG